MSSGTQQQGASSAPSRSPSTPTALNVQELTTPIAEQTKVILEGVHAGRKTALAVDCRFRIELSDKNCEEMSTKTYKGMNVTMGERCRVWFVLAQCDHYFDDRAQIATS